MLFIVMHRQSKKVDRDFTLTPVAFGVLRDLSLREP
jgi:hypothetical protein